MNRLERLIVITLGLCLMGVMATLGIFVAVIGTIAFPLLRIFKNNNTSVPNSEQKAEPLQNTIDAEFTRIEPIEKSTEPE